MELSCLENQEPQSLLGQEHQVSTPKCLLGVGQDCPVKHRVGEEEPSPRCPLPHHRQTRSSWEEVVSLKKAVPCPVWACQPPRGSHLVAERLRSSGG